MGQAFAGAVNPTPPIEEMAGMSRKEMFPAPTIRPAIELAAKYRDFATLESLNQAGRLLPSEQAYLGLLKDGFPVALERKQEQTGGVIGQGAAITAAARRRAAADEAYEKLKADGFSVTRE